MKHYSNIMQIDRVQTQVSGSSTLLLQESEAVNRPKMTASKSPD